MLTIAASLRAAALLASIAAGAAPAMPIHATTIAIWAPSAISDALVAETVAEADAIWREAGIEFDWRVVGRRGYDVFATPLSQMPRVVIVADPGRAGSVNPADRNTALGWIAFADGRPDSQIVLSLGNAEAFMLDSRNVVGRVTEMTRIEHDRLLGRMMGRALAHELAHYFLETKGHTKTGLLQASHTAREFFGIDRSRFLLSPEQRDLAGARVRRTALVATR